MRRYAVTALALAALLGAAGCTRTNTTSETMGPGATTAGAPSPGGAVNPITGTRSGGGTASGSGSGAGTGSGSGSAH